MTAGTGTGAGVLLMAVTDVTFNDYQRYVAENKGQKVPKQPFWATMRHTGQSGQRGIPLRSGGRTGNQG